MNVRFPREPRPHVGSGPRYGVCCAILPIRGAPVMGKQNYGRDGESRGPCASATEYRVVIALIMNGHAQTGSNWPHRPREQTFALAQEQLEKNKHHSPRRTIEPTLLQGMLVCQQCGYGLYRTSTTTSKQKLNYYRCIGSDGYRRLKGPVCTNRPIRQDYLDQFVRSEVIRLLEDPTLVQAEIDRRQEVARNADPLRRREEELHREQARLDKSSERLVTAYQEGLFTLPQLRYRMPDLRKQAQ